MGASMSVQEKIELTLDISTCILVAVEIVTSALFIRLTHLLNAIDRAPIQTMDEALRQRNTYVLFKTNALLSKQNARNELENNLRTQTIIQRKQNYFVEYCLAVLFLNGKLSEQKAKLYLQLDKVFGREAYFNKFRIFRALFYNSNIPRLYPARSDAHAFQHTSSVFLSQNMLTFGKMNDKGEFTLLFLGFNRQFMKKIFTRQRQICLIEFFVAFGLLLQHKKQIINFYKWLGSSLKKIFTRRIISDIRPQEACIICYVAPRDLVFGDCKHFIVCSDCAEKNFECPYCRIKIRENKIKVRSE